MGDVLQGWKVHYMQEHVTVFLNGWMAGTKHA
jgi:hypothetical protein